MSVVDRLDAAKHSLMGSAMAKIACKASSREVMGPKRKHVDYLIQCTNSDHISIPNLADILFERCSNSNWTVVFKALITFHHLMSYGNERFIQYLASRTTNWNSLANFMDKSGVQGYDMSTFVRRYSVFLNKKAVSYRTMAYDFCRLKRGKEDGVLRAMDSTKLLKALPVLQQQIDALLEVDIKASELTNGVINSAFVLLFKDLIRLFACYNDGIINLLEKYFDMNKKECKQALDVYKKFIVRMDRVSDFLKVAEDVGFDKDDIPDLSKAPGSLLDALENHLQSLEKGKPATSSSTAAPTLPSIKVPSVVSDAFQMSGGFATKFEESENTEPDPAKSGLIEEEEKYLEAFKKAKETGTTPQLPFPSTQQQSVVSPDVWKVSGVSPPRTQTQVLKSAAPSDDLLQLNAAFAAPVQQQTTSTTFSASSAFPPSQAFGATQPAPSGFGASPAGPWGGPSGGTQQSFNPFESSRPSNDNADFDAVFGGTSSSSEAAIPIGDVLTPTVASTVAPGLISQQLPVDTTDGGKAGDLHTKLQRVAKSLDSFSISNGAVSKDSSGKTQHQWAPSQPQVKTGGTNWQPAQPLQTTMPTTQSGGQMWGGAPGMMQQGMYRPPMGQPMAQPYLGQPGMYQKPVAPVGFGSQTFQPRPQQPQDPFGPIPGSQVRF